MSKPWAEQQAALDKANLAEVNLAKEGQAAVELASAQSLKSATVSR